MSKASAATVAEGPVGEGRRRVVIENVRPCVEGGRFPIKRCVGESVVVTADAFLDGHDSLRCVLLHRRRGDAAWQELEMRALPNDTWEGSFDPVDIGAWEYTVTGWADEFASWRKDLARWTEPEDVAVSLAMGAEILARCAKRASGDDERRLAAWSEELRSGAPVEGRRDVALDPRLSELASRYPDRQFASTFHPVLEVTVDPVLARFSAWYELFPRSLGKPGAHGTFADCERALPGVAAMGFDVLYFPPIHPIGLTRRKGRNNAVTATKNEPGSPWAIGSTQGGHLAIHPELGTEEDFRRLVRSARMHGIEVALDIAFQSSPDHPYVKAHPEWFRHRPDGSVQYAENPPKKYQDIYPFHFETDAWRELWDELAGVFRHWIGEGVRVFRVDNPHTKPFAFWEWAIASIKAEHPEVLFLAEAFTRPKIMHRLAKLGFSQSYTYFTWRNTRAELTEYFTELSQSDSREYFRPNVWPNTPDILHEYLQHGGRPAFAVRLVLAATLSSSYGVYGPAFELADNRPREPGSEEYLDSEKYEIRHWNTGRADSLRPLMTRLNGIRRENAALQHNRSLLFLESDNERILCYAKTTDDLSNVVVTAVNLNPFATESAWVDLPARALGLPADGAFDVHDLLGGQTFRWRAGRNYVELRPGDAPAHVLRLPGVPS